MTDVNSTSYGEQIFPIPLHLLMVMEYIYAGGGRPVVVGGAVRDFLLDGREVKDYDVEVYGLDIDALEKQLAKNFEVNAVGKSFGVLKVSVAPGIEPIDVSLPRREVKTGTGHGGFETMSDPSMSFEEAASRRDFTINAIGFDPAKNEFLDPFNGRQDLKDGMLRATSDSFGEDPLRVLRACQFAARFVFNIEHETLEMCRELLPELPSLASERLWEEFKKLLLKAEKPSIGIQAMYATGALSLFPELMALRGVPQEPSWHPEGWSVTPASGPIASLPRRISMEVCTDDRGLLPSLFVLADRFVAGTAQAPGLVWATGSVTPTTDEGFWVVVPVSFSCMHRVMLSSVDDFQVLQQIIGPVAVFVMNMLFPEQSSSDLQFHENAVKTNGPIASWPTGIEVTAVLAELGGSTVDGHVTLAFKVGSVGDIDFSHTESVYHAAFDQSLWVHNNMVIDEAAKIIRRDGLLESDPEEALITMLGALCHDLGKPHTTKFVDGKWRAHGHEEEGEIPTRTFLARINCPKDIVEAVVAVVVDHLKPSMYFRQKSGAPAVRRLATRVPLERLCRVSEADSNGRTTERVLAGEPYEAGPWLLEKATNLKVRKEKPVGLLMGRHLLSIGFSPGPVMGEILAEAFEAQMDGEFEDEAGAIAWATQKFGEDA